MDALSVIDGGVGAKRESGGRDQAMRPRVRQRASEEEVRAVVCLLGRRRQRNVVVKQQCLSMAERVRAVWYGLAGERVTRVGERVDDAGVSGGGGWLWMS